MNPKEYLTIHASFSLSERDFTALDTLAEYYCLRNRSEVVRSLIRNAIENLNKTKESQDE